MGEQTHDLFGEVSQPAVRTTLFGEAIDELARKIGGWPPEAIVHSVAVLNANQIMATGAMPSGSDAQGWPKFSKNSTDWRAVVAKAAYREACAEQAERDNRPAATPSQPTAKRGE